MLGDFIVDVQAKVAALPRWDADVETPGVDVLPGGSASNTARQLSTLSSGVLFFGTCGADVLGKAALEVLRGQRFDISGIKQLAVPSSVCLVLSGPSDRAFVTSYSSVERLTVSASDAQILQSCAHIHVGGYYGLKGLQKPAFTALLRKCRRNGATLSLATQHDPSNNWLAEGHLVSVLPVLDVFITNESECHAIEKALRSPVQQMAPQLTLVVTLGEEGARVQQPGHAPVHVPARRGVSVVDSCGAGDAFTAGFLAHWILTRDAVVAAAWGNAAACCNIQRSGACAQPGSKKEVEAEFLACGGQ